MGLLKNIEWESTSNDLILYRYPIGKKDQVNKGSALTVRESQVAIFLYKGKLADVFLPGYYKLDTDNMPVLTKLMSWKYGFETPFKADIYFVNTKQFTNLKWGTSNPIIIRDSEYGTVRVRGFGVYSFQVDDAYVFMKTITGTNTTFDTTGIQDYLRSIVVRGITDTIGERKISVIDMAANLDELSEMMTNKLSTHFQEIGLKLTKVVFESFSLPEELEKIIDKNSGYGVLKKNLDVYTKVETIEAMKEAAKHNNAGMGLGMGVGLGNMFGAKMGDATNESKHCPECGAEVSKRNKFCPECGTNLKPTCSKCGTELKAGTKFCPECGEKVGK